MTDGVTPGRQSSWWQLVLVQPARAVTVYAALVLIALAFILGGVAYVNLLARTSAVCGPLRSGQHAGEQFATTQLGRDFTRTFQHSADELGCAK